MADTCLIHAGGPYNTTHITLERLGIKFGTALEWHKQVWKENGKTKSAL